MTAGHQFDSLATEMVEKHLRQRGIRDERVLEAMRAVPRHEFVPKEFMRAAYDDRPLPIGARETISQPYIIAVITEAAKVAPGDNALEIGCGSGYQSALLAHLGAHVCCMESNPRLAEESRERLIRLGYPNIEVINADGSVGFPDRAPFDVIIISAGAPSISSELLNQLGEGGRLVAPIGSLQQQELQVLTRQRGLVSTRLLGACQFVPLIGKGGWKEEETGN